MARGLNKLISLLVINGQELLMPLLKGSERHVTVRDLCSLAKTINNKRNDIAHRGEFCSEQVATKLIENCERFVLGL